MPKNERSENLNDSQPGQELAPIEPSNHLKLGQSNQQLDLSGLTAEQQQQLIIKHAEAQIEVDKKTQELSADVAGLHSSLGIMASNTRQVAADGHDVTLTQTQDNALGRTEIIMGTSDAAKKGKLTRSQTGKVDHTYLYVGVVIFIVVVIAMVAMSQ